MLDSIYQQNQSPFFQRLPAELRLIIYAFVFPSQSVHIMITVRNRLPRLVRVLCKLEAEMSYNSRLNDVPCFYATRYNKTNTLRTPRHYQPLAIGGLVRACRLLRVESVPLLYTKTSFAFDCIHCFNAFCKAISVNQQLTSLPLMFIRDIRICIPSSDLFYRRNAHAGLILLTEQAVNLKRFELAVQDPHMRNQGERAHIWCGERGYLFKETLRILGRFRGLESFDLKLTLSPRFGDVLKSPKMSVIAKILRELVSRPKGSGTMTARKFHNHFKIRYQALMTQRRKRRRLRK
jgi:2EXR family